MIRVLRRNGGKAHDSHLVDRLGAPCTPEGKPCMPAGLSPGTDAHLRVRRQVAVKRQGQGRDCRAYNVLPLRGISGMAGDLHQKQILSPVQRRMYVNHCTVTPEGRLISGLDASMITCP